MMWTVELAMLTRALERLEKLLLLAELDAVDYNRTREVINEIKAHIKAHGHA